MTLSAVYAHHPSSKPTGQFQPDLAESRNLKGIKFLQVSWKLAGWRRGNLETSCCGRDYSIRCAVESMQDRAPTGAKALTGTCIPLDKTKQTRTNKTEHKNKTNKPHQLDMVCMRNQTQIIENSLLTFYLSPFPLLIRVSCLTWVVWCWRLF